MFKITFFQGQVPERCNNPIPGINVPGIRHIYPWNRVITPFRNPAQVTDYLNAKFVKSNNF